MSADAHVDNMLFFRLEECHVVNNLEFVLNAIRPLPEELGTPEILSRLEQIHGGLVGDACKKTVDILVKNATEILENQILEILDDLSDQMAPDITAFLLEATPTDRSATPIKLLRFLDTNLIFLKTHLVPVNFKRVLTSVWFATSTALASIVEQAILDKRDVACFKHLQHVFIILLNFFFGDDIPARLVNTIHIFCPKFLLFVI